MPLSADNRFVSETQRPEVFQLATSFIHPALLPFVWMQAIAHLPSMVAQGAVAASTQPNEWRIVRISRHLSHVKDHLGHDIQCLDPKLTFGLDRHYERIH